MKNLKTLIIDNYDSFTYNLYQYFGELGGNPVVFRNDQITLDEIKKLKPTHIVFSPGPGRPEVKKDFGICGDILQNYDKKTPILGVCLGHQGIIHFFGGKVIHAPLVMHGKQSEIILQDSVIFQGLKKKINVMRYHSLIGEKKSLPKCLKITSETAKESIIMSVEHVSLPIYGIQFHPESIGTIDGKRIISNFLSI